MAFIASFSSHGNGDQDVSGMCYRTSMQAFSNIGLDYGHHSSYCHG